MKQNQRPTLNRNTIRQSFVLFQFVQKQKNNPTNLQIQENKSVRKVEVKTTQNSFLFNRYQDQSYTSSTIQQKLSNKQFQAWYHFIKKFRSIQPQSTFLLLWNLFVEAAILFNFYQIPVSIFFTEAVYRQQFHSPLGIILNTIFTCILFINTLIVRPLTAYYNKGALIASRRLIVTNYIKIQFWLNSLAWLSLFTYIFANNHQYVYVKLLFYLFIYSLIRVDSLILSKIQIWAIRTALYKLFKLISMLLMILFWIAGIFFAIDYHFYVSQNQYYPVNLWLTNSVSSQYADGSYIDLIKTYDWYVWLSYAMYWALQTVSTLGYGDLTPRNPYQVAYCDIIIVFFCIIYAFFLNQVWEIIYELLDTDSMYKSKVVKYYERNYKIDKQIVVKLENYARETAKSKDKQQKQKQINQSLSEQLKNQLLLVRQKKFYTSISFFNQISAFDSNDQFLQFFHNLANATKEARYGEEQLIFQSSFKPINLCLLILGEVQLSYSNSRLKLFIKDKNKNKAIGVTDFLCQQPASYRAKAIKYSKISQLNQKQFIRLMKQNNKVHQKCQQMLQNIKFYGMHALSSQNCWVCSSKHHTTTICPQYFAWLSGYRNLQQLFVKQTKLKIKVYRQYRPRKNLKQQKLNFLSTNIQAIQTKNQKNQIFDKAQIKNKNRIDQIKCYNTYNYLFNL